jgi:hypothetical protein
VDAVASRYDTRTPAPPVIWLSGEFVTFFNKIGPAIWLAAMAAFSRVLFRTGFLSVVPAFRFFLYFALLATVFLIWMSARLRRVGYAGRDLIVANYSSQERIPFDQVEAVEPVWWNYRRMVRIRLRDGRVIYYIPKWAAIKCLWIAPEKELQDLMAKNQYQ